MLADDFVAIQSPDMEELQRRARAGFARGIRIERSDKSPIFYSRGPSPAQIVEQALQRAVALRALFEMITGCRPLLR